MNLWMDSSFPTTIRNIPMSINIIDYKILQMIHGLWKTHESWMMNIFKMSSVYENGENVYSFDSVSLLFIEPVPVFRPPPQT